MAVLHKFIVLLLDKPFIKPAGLYCNVVECLIHTCYFVTTTAGSTGSIRLINAVIKIYSTTIILRTSFLQPPSIIFHVGQYE